MEVQMLHLIAVLLKTLVIYPLEVVYAFTVCDNEYDFKVPVRVSVSQYISAVSDECGTVESSMLAYLMSLQCS